MHGETLPYPNGYTALTLREPHGVTGHIVPWNYPMQIVGRSVGAALAMGNACVLKPAEEACLTVLAFARIAADAGLAGRRAQRRHRARRGGRRGAVGASRRRPHLVHRLGRDRRSWSRPRRRRTSMPVTLELGGKSPQLVFADADLDAALPFLVNAGIQNAGQTCSAASRILVERPVYERRCCARMAERYRALARRPGDRRPRRRAR